LPVFHLILPDLSAHARSDVAMAAFTLTSTLKSNDLGAKIQPTGATSGLNKYGNNTIF
jgi:hypothetical protein